MPQSTCIAEYEQARKIPGGKHLPGEDVAERNGNIDTDVVTEALAQSTMRITGPKYLRAGMGDAGPCHPRDNIALSFLSERLDIGYDLFHAIMRSREIQARNVRLVMTAGA